MPLLDRIDLHLHVPVVDPSELGDQRRGESSATIRQRVIEARRVQEQRFLDSSTQQMQLSARAYDRFLKVARTIADLAGVEIIDTPQLAEAVQYWGLDRPLPL